MSAYIKTLAFNACSFTVPPLADADDGAGAQAYTQDFSYGKYRLALPASGPHTLQVGLCEGRGRETVRAMTFSLYNEDYILIARAEVPLSRLEDLCAAEGRVAGPRLALGLRIGLCQVLREMIGPWLEGAGGDLPNLLTGAVRRAVAAARPDHRLRAEASEKVSRKAA